jgi:hypothetical protein
LSHHVLSVQAGAYWSLSHRRLTIGLLPVIGINLSKGVTFPCARAPLSKE